MMNDMPTDFKISRLKRDSTFNMPSTHVHPYHEIFYLASGECTFFMNHNIYKLTKGDLVMTPAGEIHKSNYAAKGIRDRIGICFRDSSLTWLRDLLGDETMDLCLTPGVISIPEKRRDYVESIMEKMIFENDGQDILSPAFIQTSLAELLLFVIRCKRFEENVIKEIDVDNRLMQEIATYIYNNYSKKISLDDMALKFHISRSYLSKKFKSVTGFGFKEYIVNVRIKNACKMLLETNMSITEIAFECGFNDSNYFGDAFRHVKGMSPNKYRKVKENI